MRINTDWQFAKLPQVESVEDVKEIEAIVQKVAFQTVQVPHTWYEDGNAYEGVTIYRKQLTAQVNEINQVFLQFDGADRWSRVYVNGQYIGEHKGGYAAFAFDITDAWIADKKNELVVLLDNRSWDIISPLTGDFTVFGGMYRDVHLTVTPEIAFDRTYYGTEGVIVCTDVDEKQNGIVTVEVHTKGVVENAQLEMVCKNQKGSVVARQMAAIEADSKKYLFTVANPTLWKGKESHELYTVEVKIVKNETICDTVTRRIGFKTVALDSNKGFFLNGEHLKINGVAKHQDFAGVFNATNKEHQEKDLEAILDIGANSVRLSHYQHPQYMYDLCDENGLIVWAEIPFLKIARSKEFLENACNQLTELILQNMHHVSVSFWGVQNEIAMFAEDAETYRQVRVLDDLVKSLDTTRISSAANLFCVKNDSALNKITQAVGYNIYFGWYYGQMSDNDEFIEKFHADNPNIPLGITEYGVDCNLAFHNTEPKVRDYSEEFQAMYHETVYPMFAAKEYIWGTYVWNMFDFSSGIRDEGGTKYKNCKGLVTFDRQIKKDAFYYYKSRWSEEAFVHIGERRFKNRLVGKMDVKVYSNQSEVTLEARGKTYTEQSDTGVFIFTDIPVTEGEFTIAARSVNCTDEVSFTGVTQADTSYVFVDKNPGLNVKNWFEDAVEEAKMFPKGMHSIRSTCKELLESDEAMQVIEEFNAGLAKQMKERMAMIPLERILSYMKKEVTEEQCKELNSKLTQIRKED